MEAWHHTIVVQPSREALFTDALEVLPGFRILTNKFVPEGKAIVIDDEKMEELLKKPITFEMTVDFEWR